MAEQESNTNNKRKKWLDKKTTDTLKSTGASAAVGAVVGGGISAAVGGMGLAVGGTALAITAAPMMLVGMGAGAAVYGLFRLAKKIK